MMAASEDEVTEETSWIVATTKKLTEFYKDQTDYGKKNIRKKALTTFLANLEKGKAPHTLDDVK